jgi:hypothetical protein
MKLPPEACELWFDDRSCLFLDELNDDLSTGYLLMTVDLGKF